MSHSLQVEVHPFGQKFNRSKEKELLNWFMYFSIQVNDDNVYWFELLPSS